MGEFAGPAGVELNGPLLSIHMHSNRPDDFVIFLDRLEQATQDLAAVEVVVKIDDNDAPMNALLPREVARRGFRITSISTPPPASFFDLWRCFHDLLRAADPQAYFVLNLNDEMSFSTRHWDQVLRRYVGLFPDHLFRLRTSPHRNRNYYDFWEAGFANDTSAIMTKRWLEVGGGWCPCNGPDTFQQSVAFYFGWLDRFNAQRPCREFPIYDLELGGHGASHGLTGAALRRRQAGSLRPYFVLMSHEMQEEAARRARKLHAHIRAFDRRLSNYRVLDNAKKRRIEIVDESGVVLDRLPYRLSAMRIGLTNAVRRLNFGYYCAGGRAGAGWITNVVTYFCLRHPALDWFLDEYYAAGGPKPADKPRTYYLRRLLIRALLFWPQGVIDRARRGAPRWWLPRWASRIAEIARYQFELLREVERDPSAASRIARPWKAKLYLGLAVVTARMRGRRD